jgi:transposase
MGRQPGLEPAPRRWDHHSRAPACRRGAKKGDPGTGAYPDEALGRSQGGWGTKIHLRAEGRGKPVAFLITAGQRREQSVFEPLMEAGTVKRPGGGRPRIRPDRVAGDKGYSGRKIRRYLRRRGIGSVIPRQKRERRTRFDKGAYRKRNVVENRQPQYPHRRDVRFQGSLPGLHSFRRLNVYGYRLSSQNLTGQHNAAGSLPRCLAR